MCFDIFRSNGATLCPTRVSAGLSRRHPRITPTQRSLSADLTDGCSGIFFSSIRKKTHVGKISADTRLFAKITWNPKTRSEHQQTVWPTLDEFVSLTGAVQAEALRGIGIYRWQETRRGDKSDPLLSWSQSEVDLKCCWKLFFNPALLSFLPKNIASHGEKVRFSF